MKTIMFFSWQHLWSMNNQAGAPSYHHTILHYLQSEDWQVYLFTADATNMEVGKKDDNVYLFSDNAVIEKLVTVPKLNHFVLPIKHKNFTRWAVENASRIIESISGEIVLYGYEVWGVEAARKLANKYSLPLVTRFQGTILTYKRDNWFSRFQHYPHYSALSTPADLVIMTDDGTLGDITLKKLGNDSKTLFLRNGLDLYESYELIHNDYDRNIARQELGIGEDEYILLMSSRLTSWKRIDRGIRAMKSISQRRKDVKLYIAGDGDCRGQLEQLVRDLDLLEYVVFLGGIPQKQLYKFMVAADVFLSLYDMSNLGNPTFEAMLMKKAIIALNGGATSSVIQNNVNGILLEYDEENRIPEMIERLLCDGGFRKKIEEGAFGYAVKNFYSWKGRMKIEEDAINNLFC